MILAVDIGNTNISIGFFRGNRLVKRHIVPAETENYRKDLLQMSRPYRAKVNKVIVVSVFPAATDRFIKDAKKVFSAHGEYYIVGRDVKVPIKNNYNKREIGQDRLVTAYAASKIYGAPCLVIDFGTAVTFDAISEKDEYAGGLIFPGIKMSLDSLYIKTALLPRVVLKKTSSFIGRNTKTSIINGMIYGYGAVCEGMVRHFRKLFGKRLKIVATGGDAPLISKYTDSIKTVDLTLSLKGLAMLAE